MIHNSINTNYILMKGKFFESVCSLLVISAKTGFEIDFGLSHTGCS